MWGLSTMVYVAPCPTGHPVASSIFAPRDEAVTLGPLRHLVRHRKAGRVAQAPHLATHFSMKHLFPGVSNCPPVLVRSLQDNCESTARESEANRVQKPKTAVC